MAAGVQSYRGTVTGTRGLRGAQPPTAAFLPGVMARLGWDVLRATHRGQENAARFDSSYLLRKCRHVHRQSLRKSYIPIKHSTKGWSWLSLRVGSVGVSICEPRHKDAVRGRECVSVGVSPAGEGAGRRQAPPAGTGQVPAEHHMSTPAPTFRSPFLGDRERAEVQPGVTS